MIAAMTMMTMIAVPVKLLPTFPQRAEVVLRVNGYYMWIACACPRLFAKTAGSHNANCGHTLMEVESIA